jgi:GT2 family glycosyltransferase
MSAGSDSPVFSVVVPTVGRERQLEGCLGALAGLDYPRERLEVVVVNDSGKEAIDELAARWRERLPLTVVSTGTAGPSAARNAGAATARGLFIAFTDDDCEPTDGWLRAFEPVLEENPGCAAGGTLVNGGRGRFAAGSQTVLNATHDHFNRDPSSPRFYASCNIAFPAEEFRAVGGFDEGLLHGEDRELCMRWLRSGRRLVPAPSAVVRHMRELTAREFWRQHFDYGKGAWPMRDRYDLGMGRFRLEAGFYSELARHVWRDRNGNGLATAAALAVTSQIALAAGFAREGLVSRRRARPKQSLELSR